jgi:hypothetical protein
MDLAVDRADLYCLVRVAGLDVILQLTEEAALADFQRCVAEEAGLAVPAMVVEFPLAERSWTPQSLYSAPEGRLN